MYISRAQAFLQVVLVHALLLKPLLPSATSYTDLSNSNSFIMSSDSHPRTAIVTGSARGIGKSIAIKLASDGYDVTVADLPIMKAEAEATAAEIEKLGRKCFVGTCDVSKREEVEKLVADHVKALGPLFTMVANAGICQVKPAVELSEEDMRRMFEVNVYGVFNSYQAAAKQLIKQKTPGRLIGCSRYAGSISPILSHLSTD